MTSERRRRVRLWHVRLAEWPGIFRRMFRQAARDRVTMVGASLSFHAVLCLLPLLIAAVGMLALVGLSSSALHSLFHDTAVLLPSQMSQIINEQLKAPASRRANLVEAVLGIAVALWSAVEAMAALQVALDVAYEVPHDRGLLGRRLVAFPLIGLSLVLGGVASILLVLGGPIEHLLPHGAAAVVAALRYAGSFVLVTLLLSAYYDIGPARAHDEWEWVSPGAVAAALGWLAAAAGFSFYLDHFGHESRTYGALAGAAVTLLWLFVASVIVLLGAELNRELERLAEPAAS